MSDPHRGGQLRRETNHPRVGVVVLRAGLAGRDATLERRSTCRTTDQHALENVHGSRGHVGGENLNAVVGVLVHDTVGSLDSLDVVRLDVQATVGQRLRTRGHVERTHFVRAGGETRIRTKRVTLGWISFRIQVQIAGHSVGGVHDTIETNDLRQACIRAVDREPGHFFQLSNRATDSVGGHEGIVGIVGVGKGARQGTVDQIIVLCSRGNRRRQDEHLDARARLAGRQRHVHLVTTGHERLPADHGSHRTGLAVERNDGRVDSRRIHGQLFDSGFLSGGLSRRIEGGVNPQTATEETVVALLVGVAQQIALVQQVRLHFLAEVRAGDLLLFDLLHLDRKLPTARTRLLYRDVVGGHQTRLHLLRSHRIHQLLVDQRINGLPEPATTLLGMSNRVVGGWRLNESGEECAVDQGEILHSLSEVDLGGGLNPVRVVAEEHRVQITLQDLFLGALFLEPQRIDDLKDLVPTVSLEAREIFHFHDLLRDRRGTLTRSPFEVRQCRSEETANIHAVMVVVLAVLDGQYRRDHLGRHLRERHRLTVLQFVGGNFVALRVVDVGALSDAFPVGKGHRALLVRVGDPPQPRSHADNESRDDQRSRHDDHAESHPPGEESHNVTTVVVAPSDRPSPHRLLSSHVHPPSSVPFRRAGTQHPKSFRVDRDGASGGSQRFLLSHHARPLR